MNILKIGVIKIKNNRVIYSKGLIKNIYLIALIVIMNLVWVQHKYQQEGGCPKCKHKTEKKLYQWLKENVDYHIKHQAKYDWCKQVKTNNHFPFDFAIEELKLIIELDGEQHFRQVGNWATPDYTRSNDVFKMHKLLENGYSIVRLLQCEVYYDKNDWQTKLREVIKIYDEPSVITISAKNRYENHLADLDKFTLNN